MAETRELVVLELWISPVQRKDLESEMQSAVQLRDWVYLAQLIQDLIP